MKKVSFTYWRDGKFYIGYLNQYPDYLTQGLTKNELTENLKSILEDIKSREVPYIRKVEEVQGSTSLRETKRPIAALAGLQSIFDSRSLAPSA